MKNFCLIASAICGILFAVCIAGVGTGIGTTENLIAFGILDVIFYLQYLNCKIDELKKK